MKTLIIDCDGVLFPESQFKKSDMGEFLQTEFSSNNILKEKYIKLYKEIIIRKGQGFFNFIFNLFDKDMTLFDKFCFNMFKSLDYSKIKRDDELFELLLKVGQKYDICILSNNHKYHLDRVYRNLFGKTIEQFPFKSYDISSTLKDGYFHRKQSSDGYKIFLEKINKKNTECIVLDDSLQNIEKCSENKIPYILITNNITLKMVLNKLIN